MDTTLWLSLAAIIALLAMSFFFSGSETALTAASRVRMHQLARSGNPRATLVEKLTSEKERLIGAILLGNNVVNILASTLAASVLIQIFGEAGIAYATLAMTAAVVIFSEVLPKTLALLRPDGFALVVAPVIRVIVFLFAPVTHAVQGLVNIILRAFGLDTTKASAISAHEELRGTVDYFHSEGEVVKHDRDMLDGILDLRELEVSDVMVHRTRMLALDADMPADELIGAILDSPFTRVPLYREKQDNIVGIVHAKDLLRAIQKAEGDVSKVNVQRIAFKPWFVPDTTSVQAQLNAFLKRKLHFALVVDEYGEVQGLVTLEDILEEIVGDIADEHDTVIEGLTKQADGSYIMDGSLPIRDLNRALDWNLPDEEATTLAGLVIHEAKLIPEPGQQFTFHNLRFKVLKKTHNRITQLRVTPIDQNVAAK
ncbi:HlyC/CorC family transporter [Pelagibacterium xiamenense]|uniref:HlyC/CorC family transporter n=1 Tax=Pelagibacterium xiamenense TaxID=2901140 RepID=UPI001E5B69F2|nr:HlyC/CorC family transporter [Pelagibacterium xiamenense]MCD7061266.1 HlyC/CorC family transporter [Pelagibacterium xiamenense]